MNELIEYNYDATALNVTSKNGNYVVSAGGEPKVLKRDIDFGTIKNKNGDALTKNPTLFKSGAEKVCIAYGLSQNYEIVSKIEEMTETGAFFFYVVECKLKKIFNGKEYVITSAYGSANTREKRVGSQSAYDGANSTLKMAQKRALVSAALSLGCISDMFTQDIESEDMGNYDGLLNKSKDGKVTAANITYFYTIATRNGITKNQAKELLKKHGYDSAKDIKMDDFDSICEELKNYMGENNNVND